MIKKIIFIITIFLSTNLYSQLATNAPWPMFRQNLRHTGQTNDSVLGVQKNPVVKWIFNPWGNIRSSPAIGSDGTIYIGHNNKKLYAITNGYPKWEYLTGGAIVSSPAIGSDGTIYFGSYDKKLYALNPDGSYKWAFSTSNVITSSPSIGSNNIIYIGSRDNKLYAIYPDGTLKWTNRLGGIIDFSSPAVSLDGTIYIGCNDSKLYAINPDGTLKWTNKISQHYLESSPAIGPDGTIYIGTHTSKLYAFNPDGTGKWTNNLGSSVMKSSPAIGPDGTIYIGCWDAKVYAFNPDGTLKWTNRLEDSINSSPAISADNTVYIGICQNGKKVYALTNGSVKWVYTASRGIYTSPAIGSDGTIYIADYDGRVYSIIQNYEPQLIWSSNTGYSNDGVQPDNGYNGQYFRFEVKYKDRNNDYPSTNQVWIDLDDNGSYENDEKFSIYSNSGTSYSNGIIYTNLIQAFYAGDGIINYRFHYTDKYNYIPLPCAPISNHTFTVTNTNISHQLIVTKNTDINGICDSYTNNVVMSIQIWDSKHNHYLTGFQVGNASNMILGTDFSNVQLWYDENENYKWDISDVFVTALKWDGVSLWTNNNINFTTNLAFPRDFLITIDLYTNATVSNAFQSFIPVKGIKCSGGTNVPLIAITNDGCMIIGPYLNVITNKSIQAVSYGFNIITMAIRISGSLKHTLTGFKLGNAGNMVQGSDITNIQLYHDKNGSFAWEGSDKYITNLIWNGVDLWTNNNINFTNKIAPYLDIIVNVEFSYTVTESNTFRAYIPKNGVQSSGGKYAPNNAITNNGDVTVYQYLGPVNFDFTLGAPAVAVGDINNNGYLDIIAAGYNHPNRLLRKYINNGDNIFTGSSIGWAGWGKDRASLSLGDLDNDGYLDLVVSGEIHSLRWYLNDGTGSFVFKGVGFDIRDGCVILGDIDGDGDLDLITSGNGGGVNRLDKYINDGTGSFTNSIKAFGIGVNQSSLALGDIDNDGDLDLIVGGSGRLDKYINDGSSTNFAGPYPFAAGIDSGCIAMGDINGDGSLDFIVSGSGTLCKYINDGTGNFTKTALLGGFSASTIALGDIDNDGDLDFIVTGKNVGYLYKYINDGTGLFVREPFGRRVGWHGAIDYRGSVALGDLDNDGDLDLITAGSRTFWTPSGCVFNRYYNTERTVNNKPNTPAPAGLNCTNIADYLRLKWNAPVDDHTPLKMLRYKVAFGTNTGNYSFSSTNIDYPRGQANLGNVCVVTGTYYQTKVSDWQDVYWKVCAIDSAFIFSDYSVEHHAFIPRVHNITKGIDYSSISRSLIPADNGDHIQADKWSFPEQVNINGFTNLFLESTEWASNNYYTNTFIVPSNIPQYGVKFLNSKNVTLRGFTIKNSTNAILVDAGMLNKITHNLLISNYGYSIKINNSSTGNSIKSNISVYNSGGIEINNSSSSTLFRNAIYYNDNHGILLDNGNNNYIVNNSIASNGMNAGDGISLNNNSDNNIIKNNIIAFTKSGFGINLNSGVLNSLTYNDVYGNSFGNYNGLLTPGIGTITNNPFWYDYNIYSTNFLYLENISSCIDAGDPNDPVPANGGLQVDMGWKEFTRPYLTVELNKSITNITLGINNTSAIPGSTIEYKINCQINSYGGLNGQNMVSSQNFMVKNKKSVNTI